MVSHPVNYGACLEPTRFALEPNRDLTVEKGSVDTAKFQSVLYKLYLSIYLLILPHALADILGRCAVEQDKTEN